VLLEPSSKYVILDFETTGLDPTSSEIIEIGAILVDGLEAGERFHALLKPARPVPWTISQITGITNEMLEGKPPLSEVAPAFLDFLRDYPIVAHNAAMERSFLDHHVSPWVPGAIKSFAVHNSIEPLALLLPDRSSHSMENLRAWAGIVTENAHRADQDCEDLLKLLRYGREFLLRERPFLIPIVQGQLGGAPDTAWWWTWFFAPVDGISTLPTVRAPLGDLKDLRAKDTERAIDWTQAVSPNRVREALQGGAKSLASAPEAPQSGFEQRETQEKMALEVAGALAQGERIAIEAPTGTGKSVAYLLPGVLAARATGAPLVVSTHSKSLQDQLLEKDIPIIRKLTGLDDLRAATVKGQDNYLCLRKLNDVLAGIRAEDSLEERWSAAYLSAFAATTRAAEIDRISHYLRIQFPALNSMVEQVRSHFTTTIGPSCPFYRECHFFDSARLAHAADVIIANHSLVFQWPAHLPQIRNIVFDEAHHLEDQITDSFAIGMSEEELSEACERLTRKPGSRKRGEAALIGRFIDLRLAGDSFKQGGSPDEKITAWVEKIRTRVFELRHLVPLAVPRGGSDSQYEAMIQLGSASIKAAESKILEGFSNLGMAVKDLSEYLGRAVEASQRLSLAGDPAYDALKKQAFRFEGFSSALDKILDANDANWLRLIHWDPRESIWRFSVSPVEVAGLSEPFFAGKRGIVLTSATLTSGQPVRRLPPSGAANADPSAGEFVTGRIGLKASKPLISLPSPYALERQAVVYFPTDVAPPGTPSHLEALIEFTEQIATALRGRTLLLMTSNRRLRHAADILHAKLSPRGISVFDSVSDRRAADHFRASEHALLIGSERYGEGLDIPGRQLSCVIIEKINEAMTRSPLAEARKARTKFGLYDYDFPLRMMWLKQRVGRLIRSPIDTGAVVVFDPRYPAWSPSSRAFVERALAPMPILREPREKIVLEIEKNLG